MKLPFSIISTKKLNGYQRTNKLLNDKLLEIENIIKPIDPDIRLNAIKKIKDVIESAKGSNS